MEDKINEKLSEINKKLLDLAYMDINTSDYNEKKVIDEQATKLYEIKQNLEEKIDYLHRKIVVTDGEIELTETHKPFAYNIYLCNHANIIGHINYREEISIGNIGWKIEEKYRGHNYSEKAFNLLRIILANQGIEDVIIMAKKDNIPSIKTIENIGGQLIECPYDNVLAYKVFTNYNKTK